MAKAASMLVLPVSIWIAVSGITAKLKAVVPAQAGTNAEQMRTLPMDSGLRRNDGLGAGGYCIA
ncbi:hypothetical protein GCM10027320_42870 [Massilia solisilvae]